MNTTDMFPLGQIIITPAALDVFEQVNISPDNIIQRHVLGDWGDMVDADKKANELAVEMGGRILSAYKMPGGNEVWVTTEPDRNHTTIMLPREHQVSVKK
jgi:hypothetical protein